MTISLPALQAVRELLEKMPTLPALIAEVQKPVVRTWAETAWIWNAFDDVTLYHVGMAYELKCNQLTKIPALNDYREIDQAKSTGSDVVWTTIQMSGEFIAGELIYEHGLHDRGFMVLTEPHIPAEQKTRCEETAKQFKLTRIEEFKVHRDKARAGIVGYKINPDPSIYRWMQVYSPDDPMFAEQHRKSDTNSQLASAIELLTRLVSGQQQGTVTAANTPPPEPSAAETGAEGRPRRKPFESTLDYNKRVDQWKAEQALVQT